MLRRTISLACNTKHVGRLSKISLMPFYGQRWKIFAFISFLFVFTVKMKALAFATFAEVWHESKIKKPCIHFSKAPWVNVWLAETALHFKVIVHYKALLLPLSYLALMAIYQPVEKLKCGLAYISEQAISLWAKCTVGARNYHLFHFTI